MKCLKQSDVYGMIARGAQGDPIDLEVVVHEWGKVEGPFAVYGQVSATDVADWWAKYYPRLVEPNIRGFLGTDTEVNSGLQQTLLHEPEHFWHYNNGLTVICHTITRKMMGGPGREAAYIVCHGASIVNGAQTAGSIAAAHAKKPEAVTRARVPARFIEVEARRPRRTWASPSRRPRTRRTASTGRTSSLSIPSRSACERSWRSKVSLTTTSQVKPSSGTTTFDLEEATVALACAHPDLAFSTQAKREIGRLWEDTSRAPYKWDRGEVDHGCGRGEGCLEILGQPSVAAEPSEGPLDQPALGQDGKAAGAGLALDDLEPQTLLCCGTGSGLPLVAAIGEDQAEPGEAPAQPAADQRQPIAILDVGGVDDDHQQQAQGVDQNVALAAVDLLAGVIASGPAGFGGPHALAVDDASGRRGLPAGLLARRHDQLGVQYLPGSILPPAPEIAEHRALGRQLLGQEVPGAAGAQQIEDGVQDLAQIHLPWPPEPAGAGRWGAIKANSVSVRSVV